MTTNHLIISFSSRMAMTGNWAWAAEAAKSRGLEFLILDACREIRFIGDDLDAIIEIFEILEEKGIKSRHKLVH